MILILCLLIIHTLLIFFIAPLIDSSFTKLHKTETNNQLLAESVAQLLVVSVVWYILDIFIKNINKYFGVHEDKFMRMSVDIVSGIILIGMQHNLIEKLNYISFIHPYKFMKSH